MLKNTVRYCVGVFLLSLYSQRIENITYVNEIYVRVVDNMSMVLKLLIKLVMPPNTNVPIIRMPKKANLIL